MAEAANPALRSAQAVLHGAEGQLAESRALFWNTLKPRQLLLEVSNKPPPARTNPVPR